MTYRSELSDAQRAMIAAYDDFTDMGNIDISVIDDVNWSRWLIDAVRPHIIAEYEGSKSTQITACTGCAGCAGYNR